MYEPRDDHFNRLTQASRKIFRTQPKSFQAKGRIHVETSGGTGQRADEMEGGGAAAVRA